VKDKDKIVDKKGNLAGMVGSIRDITERMQGEQEEARLLAQVQEQVQHMQQIIDTVPEGVLLLNAEDQVVLANPVAEEYLVTLAEAKLASTLGHLGDRPLAELLAPPPKGLWHEVKAVGSSRRVFEVIARPMENGRAADGWVLVLRDVTQEREIQQRMRQQDRLAVIGQLAGGIAHDFNNILTTIMGYTRFALDELVPGDAIRADLVEVSKAADRAAALTRQLLAFSRKQLLQAEVLDLNVAIANVETMLRRLIGENIELNTALSPDLGRVMADPGQIEQVIMNLAVNARDAMPDGGRLTLETDNAVLGETYARERLEVEPRAYVMLAVSDTGIGMDDETKSHLFEPFFTTKEVGKGTGLGLATVYGIVKQSEGGIDVHSEPGVGTTFKVYLPRVGEGVELTGRERHLGSPYRGAETVLLVGDESTVRSMARRGLEQLGYTVLEARLAGEAMHLSQQYPGRISLLIADVVLPEMGGRDLAERLALTRPEMQVLYVSGYTDDAIVHHGVLEPGVAFLQKPFATADFVRKVREVLDASC